MANTTDLTVKQQGIQEGSKFEAKMTVFGTPIELKPTKGTEIGYRASGVNPPIAVTRAKLYSSGIVTQSNTLDKLIPEKTEVQALVYDYDVKKLEVAVYAEFDDKFILNQYKEAFTLDSVYLYLHIQKKQEEATK